MSRASARTHRARRRRPSAGLVATVVIGAVVVAAVAGVFAFDVLRPDPPTVAASAKSENTNAASTW